MAMYETSRSQEPLRGGLRREFPERSQNSANRLFPPSTHCARSSRRSED